MRYFKRRALEDVELVTRELQSESAGKTEELEALIALYQQADKEAASALVSKLSPPVFRFYLRQARSRSMAEDLLQEFWLRLHNARHTYRTPEPVLPWVFAIARRVQVDHYRRASRIQRHEISPDNFSEIIHAGPTQASRQLDDLLASLPASQKEVVVLLKEVGLTLEEVARATGTSVGAVKQKAHRAYETLRKVFGQER